MPYLSIVLFVLTVDIKTLLDAGKSSNLTVRNWILAVFQHFTSFLPALTLPVHTRDAQGRRARSVGGQALPTLQRLRRSQQEQSEIFSGSAIFACFALAVIKSMTRGQSAWVCKTKNFATSSETKRREFCSRKIVNKKNTNIEF